MKAPPKPILKTGLNILLVLAFAFSLLSASFITSHNFTHIYSEEVFENTYDVKVSFATTSSNTITIGVLCALGLAVTNSNISVVPQHVPNFATLSRAPPL